MKYYFNSEEDNRFKTISEFKECLIRGGEIEFAWNNSVYGISHSKDIIIAYVWNQPDTTQYFDTPDEVLEYMVGSDRLRDVITHVTVIDRTI